VGRRKGSIEKDENKRELASYPDRVGRSTSYGSESSPDTYGRCDGQPSVEPPGGTGMKKKIQKKTVKKAVKKVPVESKKVTAKPVPVKADDIPPVVEPSPVLPTQTPGLEHC